MATKGPLLLLFLQGVFFLLLLPVEVQSESHWESYAGWVEAYQWTCYPYTYTYCTNWYNYGYYLGYHSCGCGLFQAYSTVCYPVTAYNCFTNCIGWIPVTLWRCQWGWKGCNCDVPICNPACRSDQVCSRPNYCDCYRSGSSGECIFEPCDDGPNQNCYPGSCDKSTNVWKCVCPPGFSGPNCQTLSNTPDINTCSVQIFGTPSGGNEQEVARANECAAQGLNPLPIWIGSVAATSLRRILVTWEANYNNQLPLPDRGKAPYIINAPVPIGIVESNFTVSFPSSGNVLARSASCVNIDPSQTSPQTIQKCSVFMQWVDIGVSSIVQTNLTLTVSIEAQVGGAKRGDAAYSGGRFYTPQNFSRDPNMNTTIRTVKFAFDLEPPYHCLSTATNCSIFPIFLEQSMTSNPVIQPTFNAWNDDGSGISRFHAEVFFMQPDKDGQLVHTGDPLVAADINITLNNFRYTCTTPGAYSIVLTVYDKANNSAKARKIFNYDNHESSVIETDSPVYLDKTNPATAYQFITNLDKLQNPEDSYQFNFVWTGHFDTTYKKEWLGAVRPWQIQSGYIDDSYGAKYGLRSIDAVANTTGVLGYEIAYVVDVNGTGGVGLTAPSSFAAVSNPKSTSYPIAVSSKLKDGDTIVVWLRVYDLYGQQRVVQSRTFVDTSRFNIKIDAKNTGFRKHFPDQYNSSVALTVTSKYGGIKNITYTIKDNTRKVDVYTGTVFPKVLERPPAFNRRKRDSVEIPCSPNDKTCYCIPSGPCYNVTQLINIDNCLIDRGVTGDQVIVEYTIYTLSAWTLTGTVDAGVLSAEDIACRDVQGLGLSREARIGIGIAVAIIGILFILLIILLILMCIRWKVYHKHPVPFSIRTTIHNTFGRNRAPSAVHIMSENELYVTNNDFSSLPKKKSNEQPMVWAKKLWDVKSEDGGVGGSKVFSGKDLQMEDIIAEGRFAVIRRGNLSIGNEKTPVAVKILRSGYDKIDPEVMRSKIAFMASKVKPHPNVIRFIGTVAEDNNSQASPVMLLELCDKPLKDWLSEVSVVDNDVFEEMLSFGLQIARGVRHLHDHGIIHRRLAVRNILLKHSLSGYEVKLIGFGPAKDDYDSSDQSTMSVSMVPLKWMAPETLESLNSARPVYDKETDAWSYGVTLWEIFSKGEAPYANHKSLDMKTVLKRGERLNCPESCPPDLFNQILYPCWNSNPKKRPNFSTICTVLEKFRSDTGGGEYYAASQDQPGNSAAASPPGYYAAGSMLRDNPRAAANNAQGVYQEARSA